MSNRLFYIWITVGWILAFVAVAYGQMKPASAPCPFPRDAGTE